MGKGWGRRSKGKSNNKKQANAAEVRAAAAELAELAAQRQRRKDQAAGTAAKHTHVPQHDGRGGVRQKLDTEAMSPRSKKRIEKARVRSETFRMKQGGASEVSEAVRADPTEAWRAKATGHENKYPERARQRAAADLAAALPKNPALHGPAVAAFLSHPVGKRAAAAMEIEAPQDAVARKAAKRLDALSAMASDIGAGFSQMQARACTVLGGVTVGCLETRFIRLLG
jgi:hypothetical protein